MAQMIIHARELTRLYAVGDTTVVGIRAVDLDIAPGELVVLKGESGSGKSTLLSLLAGLDRLSTGELTVAGHDLNHCREAELTDFRRNTVGMIFQAFNLLPTLSVLENVCLPALLAGRAFRAVRSRAGELLDWLGLGDRLNHQPRQLSGGEMQRTAIARALINDPAIVLADEPTGNLDPVISWEIIQLLLRINEMGTTVMMATHDAEVVTALRRRVVALEDGRVAAAVATVEPGEAESGPLANAPHLLFASGAEASTTDARRRAGVSVAEQVAAVLDGRLLRGAVNVPAAAGDDADELMPYMGLCAQLGRLLVQLAGGPVDAVCGKFA